MDTQDCTPHPPAAPDAAPCDPSGHTARPRLNVVGAGRVGLALARLWQVAGGPLQVQALCNPGAARRAQAQALLGPAVAVEETLAALPPAEVWLLAVPDTRIAEVAGALAVQRAGTAPAQAWHCSGFLTAAELAPLQAQGWSVASVHPALSFTTPDRAMAQFAGTVCALEGDAPARALARQAFGALGGHCLELAAADKPLYHGAAVWASNFLPVLAATAQRLWEDSGVPPALAVALRDGFVRRAADNLLALGPAAALTGPAARGDTRVLQLQGQAMAARDASLGQAYAALSDLAGRLARDPAGWLDRPTGSGPATDGA
ncbi:Rossmann-like and DUF2520 domain-containing protein [Ideonella livida]|uniref:DUF2520 domain-containing protein n=1 Tax=Ideonella livida TaxID=2707176 RepID=A0A7C9TMW9_9BURK|nr:Rossmann-like and DUF2520 domain-containing protein [Ideonella livida]NDY92707.1 DUF2520 domain-containing protein [Ideonella livida]